MNRVKLVPVLEKELQCIALVEGEWVARLRVYVYSDHFKTGPCVAHPGPARAAKQVE